MSDISVSCSSRIRVWVANRSLWCLLLLWVVAYGAIGVIFALAYMAPQCAVTTQAGGCEGGLWNLIYFSLSNQSTLTYGDYTPKGVGHCLAVAQGFVGITINALVLGIVVFKALKRSSPLVFSKYVVYEVAKHKFWFRFLNVDADQLREMDVRVQFVQHSGPTGTLTDYDTQANPVEIDVPHFSVIPRLRLFADRSKSNDGRTVGPNRDLENVLLSPGHFSGATKRYVEMTVRGYFESTGDMFFHTKRYSLEDIRCGAFDGVDNNAMEGKSDGEKAEELSGKLNHVISTSKETCLACPHHEVCRFDVAVKTRAKPTSG